MFLSGKKLCVLLTAIGSVFAELKDECKFVNSLLGKDESYECCSYGYPSIKCSKEHITYIDLSGKNIEKEFPSSIGELPQLTVLNLSNNKISGSIPSDIGNLGSLIELNLSDNKISGSVPDSISKLTNLKNLVINNNELTSIPKEVTSLNLLTDLIAGGNTVDSSILKELKNMGNLRVLDLSKCNMSGTIPDEIGDIANLVTLNLSENKLEGSIPATIKKLTKLKNLYLNNNELSGDIPTSSLESLTMTEIDLSNNLYLSGKVPKLSYTTVNHLCKYSKTNLCYSKKNGQDSKCEYTEYECSSCKENASQDSATGICKCNDKYTGIGYVACTESIDDSGLNDGSGSNGANSKAIINIFSIFVLSFVVIYLSN